jgi:hypothetical protein
VSARRSRRAAALPAPALLLALAAVVAGCAGAPRPLPPAEIGERPWLLPASAYGTQRLFRGAYRGPGGDGGFRATLRLAAPDRFDLLLVDPLGRQLAALRVEGSDALLVDRRRGTHCARPGAAELPGVGPLPLRPAELPAVLLGVLPVAPSGEVPGTEGEPLAFAGADGRQWWARIEGGVASEWTVRQGLGAVWSWRRRGGRAARLAAPGGPELEWEEVVVEPLRSALPPLAPPPGSEERCAPLDEGAAGTP